MLADPTRITRPTRRKLRKRRNFVSTVWNSILDPQGSPLQGRPVYSSSPYYSVHTSTTLVPWLHGLTEKINFQTHTRDNGEIPCHLLGIFYRIPKLSIARPFWIFLFFLLIRIQQYKPGLQIPRIEGDKNFQNSYCCIHFFRPDTTYHCCCCYTHFWTLFT